MGGPEIEYREGQTFSVLHVSLCSAKVKKEQSYNPAPRVCLYDLDSGKVTYFSSFPAFNDQISQEVYQLKFCTKFSSFPCVLYSPPNSFSCLLNNAVQRTYYGIPHYTIFRNRPLLLRCRAKRVPRA